jgi:voltage-gated potassium channel
VLLSAVLMIRRFVRTLRRAAADPQFVPLAGASLALVITGTIAYTLGEDWSLVDGFYFAVATLTTSSIADPDLVLTDPWLKIFTVFYVLVGIGILVALVGRLGVAFVELRQEEKVQKDAEDAVD